tara:strand:+ start:262 stop:489 length:228 start_codon:yes stop_codon:yes gene_type:complete
MSYKSTYGNHLLSLSEDHQLIARYNRWDQSVEIADLECLDMGWTCYDPSQGASSDDLTKVCDSLYDRCLLQELAS